MSRLTAAQVVALGEYLDPDFDPATLTVAQLLGVFGFHNVNYPSQYTKPRLVQLFNDEIKTKSKKLKRERIKRENSQASDDGIKDGVTGKLLNDDPAPVRRSSRRLSRAPTEEPPEPEPAPTKRRRSSAQPSLGGPSRRKTLKPAEPILVEESEPEEEVAVRKVGRKKKTATDAGSQARRVSQSFPEESGWEDNNIFQSGAESSSPARPSPVRPRTRRPSAAPRPVPKSRKSMSAPPQYLSSSPPRPEPEQLESHRATSVKPPESSKFEPRLPPGLTRETQSTVARATRHSLVHEALTARHTAVSDELKEESEADSEEQTQMQARREAISHQEHESPADADEQDVSAEQDADDDDADGSVVEDDQVAAVSRRIAEGGKIIRRPSESTTGSMSLLRILFVLLSVLGSGVVYQYKQESASIGFCDTGSTSNAILEGIRAHAAAVQNCNADNRTTLYLMPDPDGTGSGSSPIPSASVIPPSGHGDGADGTIIGAELCPPLPLTPLPRPDTCTPCPLHATCTPSTMACENGFILRPHPLLYFLPVPGTTTASSTSPSVFTRPAHTISPKNDLAHFVYSSLSIIMDGFPGVGSVALPPYCTEDPRRKRHIGVLGKAVEAMLAAERGRRLCAGVGEGEPAGDDAVEAKRWGVELGKLQDDLRRKTAPSLQGTLDDTFNEAIQQLVQWGGVFMGEDADGKRYLAHRTPTMSWDCAITVKARDAWSDWKQTIIGGAAFALLVLAFRRRHARSLREGERVAALVQISLDLLQNQELAHHTDPVTSPQPYLSSLQLRDLVLQDEHAIRTRRRLWERVERIVEGNANVRTNLEEVAGGDELRVWRWVGSAGPALGSPEKGCARIVA